MIYFDNAATTRVDDELIPIINKYNCDSFVNPSALYGEAVSVAVEVRNARQSVLRSLGAESGKLIFTSSGTEADNQALFCTKKKHGSRIIISATEHPAVYNAAMKLKQDGYDVQLCAVDCVGRVDENAFAKLLNDNTSIVSVMHVNNETGGINNVKKLVRIAKEYNKDILFHCDGVQAFGKIDVNVQDLGVDLYTVSGHKINAPKGIAALYVQNNVHVVPYLYGGGQESNLRSSTENVSGIMAFAKACSVALDNIEHVNRLSLDILSAVRSRLSEISEIMWITEGECSPRILSFAFKSVRGEVLMHALETHGLIVGIGSACSSKKKAPRIPEAIGLPKEYHDGMLRLSVGKYNALDQAQVVADAIADEYFNLTRYRRV